VSASLLLLYTFIEPYLLTVSKTHFSHPDVPEAFDGKKIVFISDVHHGPFFSIQRVHRLVERINALKPDIILLGGDYVHREPKHIEPFFREAAALKAPLGVFAVLGNHDHWEGAPLTRKSMKEAGIELIDNRGLWIKLKDTNDTDLVLLISHNPDFAGRYDTTGVALMLSGHTHGGQVTALGMWAPRVPSFYGQRFRTGKIENGETTILVSNGVGTVTPPVRFFALPEINFVVLESEKKL
jgi:predicted MPP superfamily phosphohydrolase